MQPRLLTVPGRRDEGVRSRRRRRTRGYESTEVTSARSSRLRTIPRRAVRRVRGIHRRRQFEIDLPGPLGDVELLDGSFVPPAPPGPARRLSVGTARHGVDATFDATFGVDDVNEGRHRRRESQVSWQNGRIRSISGGSGD